MKKLFSLTLALMLALTALVSLSPAVAANAETEQVPYVNKGGVLSMLNLSEEEMAKLFFARRLINGQLAREGYQQTIVDGGRLIRTRLLQRIFSLSMCPSISIHWTRC